MSNRGRHAERIRAISPVTAGAHPDFTTAQAAMTALKEITYKAIPENQAVYQQRFSLYRDLHDSFGGVSKDTSLSHVIKLE